MPEDHTTIADAIEAAHDGDIVVIASGKYSAATSKERFPLRLVGRRLTIRGSGAWRTILDAEGRSRHFECMGRDSSTIEGLTLRNGFAREPGGALHVERSSTMFRRAVVERSASESQGQAIALMSSNSSIRNVLFAENGNGEAVALVSGGTAQITYCTFDDVVGEPIISRAGALHVERNTISSPSASEPETGLAESGAFAGDDPLEQARPHSSASGEREGEDLLGPASPNPFNPSTTVQYTVLDATVVDLGVFNVLGQRIRTLFAGDRAAGAYHEVWDGRDDAQNDMPPGVYYVRITQGPSTETRPLVLVR